MKIYISGKITGLEYQEADKLFNEAKLKLQEIGCEVINPLHIPTGVEKPEWDDYMVADIRELFKCDAIFMLKNWKSSRGARIEHYIAEEIGLIIAYEY